jgi:hypothetical protein
MKLNVLSLLLLGLLVAVLSMPSSSVTATTQLSGSADGR